MPEVLVTVNDTIERLHLGRTKVNELIRDDRIKSVKIDGARRILASSLELFIQEHLSGGGAPKSLEESQRILDESVEAGLLTKDSFEGVIVDSSDE